ncbi:MAG TPA: methyltransferase domain-containing protein [Phycisphaerales bacterium]|nr:methyltransferase domain-containing protein [Phycisphaerales bacterium]
MISSLDPVGCKAFEVALAIDLFQELDKAPGTIVELAQRCRVSTRGLRPLLFLLASVGCVKEQADTFHPSPELNRFLSERWPDQKSQAPQAGDWENLEKAVRTGRCVRPPIEGAQDGGEFFSGVVETLFGLHFGLAKSLAHALPSHPLKVLDLGAGSAVWSLGLAVQRDDIEVVAVDHQRVLESVTRKFVAKNQMEERYVLRPGDYHEVELEREHYDVIYLGHVIHSEGWEASTSLLKRCKEALAPQGTVVIAEWVGSTPRADDYHANLFDLNMLMFTEHGLVFDVSEMEELASRAGFGRLRWVKGAGKYPVLFASTDS